MAETIDRIPQHRHCVNCGKAFVGEGRFRSEFCKETAGDEVKGKLKKLGLIWVAIVVVTIVLVVFTLGAQ
mgnify:CR=1 FL=1